MPDPTLNHADRWDSPPPIGATANLPGLALRLIACPEQHLVSGDLLAFARLSGFDPQGAGALGQVEDRAYSLRLARDRLLAVGPLASLTEGWHPAGFALTAIGAGLDVIELTGPALPDIVERAAVVDATHPSPSALIGFAGVPVIACRHGPTLRLHVERGLCAYLWLWLTQTATSLQG